MNRLLLNTVRQQTTRRSLSTASSSANQSPFYKYVLQSNATYTLFIFAGAFVASASFNYIGDTVWDTLNSGRQYKSIDHEKVSCLIFIIINFLTKPKFLYIGIL